MSSSALLDKLSNTILPILDDIKGKKVIIFGAGESSQMVSLILQKVKVDLSYYVDNDPAKHNTELWNVPVKPVKEILKEDKENLCVLVASMFYPDIKSQLTDMEFEENQHFFSLINQSKMVTLDNGSVYYPDEGYTIGKYSNAQSILYPGIPLESVGAFTSFAENVGIARNHSLETITTHSFAVDKSFGFAAEDKTQMVEKYNKKVIIGNDVWFGRNVVILPSVKIGNGAIIGAGAVVSRDIPDYAIAMGVPAKVVRYRFTKEEIDILNRLKWWDWPVDKIKKYTSYFTDTKKFMQLACDMLSGKIKD